MRPTQAHRTAILAVVLVFASAASVFAAQDVAASPSQPTRVVGSITAINGQTLTIKPDTGASVTITVSPTARILQTQPGAKTLAGATPIQISGISIGDRVLAALKPSSDGASTATTLIAMKQAAVALHQQAQEADWQRRGIGGLVKTIDTATGTITIASGTHTLTIHTTPQTIVRRYSPDSIQFADAKSSALDQIHPGDQLRARGDRSGDNVTADEIVAGTFRNIAGTVVSTDPAANTVTVTDLATKKRIVIRITVDSKMHKLPERMAQFLAARLKNPGQNQEHAAAQPSGPEEQRGNGDLSQMLQRTPPVQIADLHKGDAVMIVATQGTPDSATAVTLVAGVEPILTASPSASQSMFSASWDVGGGGSAAGGEEQGTP